MIESVPSFRRATSIKSTVKLKSAASRRSLLPMALIIHSYGSNKNVHKAQIAAEYVGVELKLADNFQMGVSNKTPEFIKMNPIGKIPVLETPEGSVFESNAIARYVAYGSSLLGSSAIEYGQIEQWIDFSSFEIDNNLRGWILPRLGYANYIKPVEENFISSIKRGLAALNTHLASHTFLVGDSVTLADIITTCNLSWGFKSVLTKSFTSEFPHVERYFWTMVNQPSFSKILGEIKQADAVIPLPSAKKPEQPKEAKPKAEPKKEEAPKPVVADEEEAPKPKAKNPLDLLPPSKMVLDDWKRLYSNTKSNFREVAIKGNFSSFVLFNILFDSGICHCSSSYSMGIDLCGGGNLDPYTCEFVVMGYALFLTGFWDMFDPEGYSLWFCTYKYNDENTVSFVTMNKVGGFLQRMDLARKYAFGKMLIIGNEPPFKVKGLWLFRGPEIPQFVIDECYDMELYEWTKVDLSDEAQKERVNQMIEDHEPFEGEALLDAKCFK
ncbi:elongation factor 1-gamma-like protein [Tanacetum coccineum]